MATHYTASQPHILIFGAGAVGTCYIYILQQAGCQVATVCRSNYRKAKSDGFCLNSQIFGQNLHLQPYRVAQSKAELRGQIFDFLLVTTKAFPGTSPSTPELIRPYVSPGITTIALLQNGIGIEEEYGTMYPQNPVLSCVVNLNAVRTSPTHVHMGASEHLEIGPSLMNELNGHELALRRAGILCGLIRRGGGTASVYTSIQPKRWLKLLTNATWSPICALTQLDDASFLQSSSSALRCVKRAMSEVIDVAQALGYFEVNQAASDHVMERVLDRVGTTGYEPSMSADVQHRRPMEIEAILGNVIRIARREDVPVMQLECLYALVLGLDEAIQGS